ncbi:MAG: SRPBCC family protein [Limisphaerales bacterium]
MANNQEKLAQQLAIGLGIFSIGLGIAQLLAPRRMCETVGMKKNNTLMRAMGAREIASGVGILSQKKTTPWVWSRVAGDAMDLALLGVSMAAPKTNRKRLIAASAAVAGVAALDVYCSKCLSKNGETTNIKVKKCITIDRSPEDLYEFWHHFDRLAAIMGHLESIEKISDNRWHWVAKGPFGRKVEWDAELTHDVPNRLIAWRSLPGADVDNWGAVRFEPTSRGTIVHVEMEYCPPAGLLGVAVAKLTHEAPDQQMSVDLRQFKQLMETGEIARTEGQPAGRTKSTSRKYDEMIRT